MSRPVRIEQHSPTSTRTSREQTAANAKLQDAFVRAMTRGANRDVSQDTSGSMSNSQSFDRELTSLVERFCSGVYVGETSLTSQPRVLLALQGELPGASAEIVREGAFLRVRLRATSDEIYQRMQCRRQVLVAALTDHGNRPSVIVEVIRDQGGAHGGVE